MVTFVSNYHSDQRFCRIPDAGHAGNNGHGRIAQRGGCWTLWSGTPKGRTVRREASRRNRGRGVLPDDFSLSDRRKGRAPAHGRRRRRRTDRSIPAAIACCRRSQTPSEASGGRTSTSRIRIPRPIRLAARRSFPGNRGTGDNRYRWVRGMGPRIVSSAPSVRLSGPSAAARGIPLAVLPVSPATRWRSPRSWREAAR